MHLRYWLALATCTLFGHDWTRYASPAVTIRECERCKACRWGSQ